MKEDLPGFINISSSLAIFRVQRRQTLHHTDVPLGDQGELRGELIRRDFVLMESSQEAEDCFTTGI